MSNDNKQLNLPQIPDVMKELRLSVSKTKCWLSCRKQYEFLYILKIPRREFPFHTLGKAIHLVLELFHSDCLNGSILPLNKIMANAYKTAMEQYGSKLLPASRKEVFDMADIYLERITENKELIKSVVSVEKNFSVDIGNKVILNGMIDKVQKDPDGLTHILDYKTTKQIKYVKDDWFQLLTYAYIMYLEDPSIERVRGSYVMLRHNHNLLTKEFSLPEILDVKKLYEGYAKQIIDTTLYPANPTRLCEWCSALDHCDEGKKFLGMNTGETNW